MEIGNTITKSPPLSNPKAEANAQWRAHRWLAGGLLSPRELGMFVENYRDIYNNLPRFRGSKLYPLGALHARSEYRMESEKKEEGRIHDIRVEIYRAMELYTEARAAGYPLSLDEYKKGIEKANEANGTFYSDTHKRPVGLGENVIAGIGTSLKALLHAPFNILNIPEDWDKCFHGDTGKIMTVATDTLALVIGAAIGGIVLPVLPAIGIYLGMWIGLAAKRTMGGFFTRVSHMM